MHNWSLKTQALTKNKQLGALIVFALRSAKKGNKGHGRAPASEEGG